MPIGTAVHERTLALCESLNYREWSGYYAVSAYEAHHEHEYNAIRNAAALIDVSPLFKYLVTGTDAARLVDRHHHARRRRRWPSARSIYTPWCDEHGKVIDDGTVSRLAEQTLPLDGGRSEPALVPAERGRPGRHDRGHLGGDRGAGAAGPDVGAAARRRRRRRHRTAEVLPRDQRHDRRRPGRHLAHRLHRRSRLRDLDACGARRARLGRADGRGAGRSTSSRPACSRSTSRGSRRACCSSTSTSSAARRR